VLEHPFPGLGRQRARLAGQASTAPGQDRLPVRAGGTAAGQGLRAERSLQLLPGPVQQAVGFPGRQAEDQGEVQVVPAGQVERLELGRVQAHRRVPGRQPAIGGRPARPGRRLRRGGRGDRLVPAAFRPGQRVQPRAERLRVFGIGQPGDVRLRDQERLPQRGLRQLAASQHAPAVAEEPVTVGVEEFGQGVGRALQQRSGESWVFHVRQNRARKLLSATSSTQRVFKPLLFP
jgi:hypothetical protein